MNTPCLLDKHSDNGADVVPDEHTDAGYLDEVLTIFERHSHPFILVGILAMRWSGTNPMPDKEIDILLKPSLLSAIATDLVSTGNWVLCPNPHLSGVPSSYENTSAVRDTWLASTKRNGVLYPSVGLSHLRFWPEDLYRLSVDECEKVQIPDIVAKQPVLLEEEYYRDPHERFGPARLSICETLSKTIVCSPRSRCTVACRAIPIYIPSIEDHLNALLDQRREENETHTACGNAPRVHLRNLIRYHVWDWAPASTWLLSNKVHERNYQDMAQLLETFSRKRLVTYDRVLGKVRFNLLPWELTPGT